MGWSSFSYSKHATVMNYICGYTLINSVVCESAVHLTHH
jgi:hypothetical protein